jgi:hypothetical protein
MSKNNPKTIADLDFNWTFYPSHLSSIETIDKFQKLNSKLSPYRIKEGTYCFVIGNNKFEVYCFYSRPIEYFFEDIVYFSVQFIHSPLNLDYFQLIAENTFRIHFK